MEYRTINNGVKMPALGFGVFQVADPKVCEESDRRIQFWERSAGRSDHE